MNKIACQYAIVRFAPYMETEEFANVGILLISPKNGFFSVKLETRRYRRVTHFFDDLKPALYREALYTLKDELDRIQNALKTHRFEHNMQGNRLDYTQSLFDEVIRPRESIVRFSQPRVILANDPEMKLNELFAFYIERNFVTKEYREKILEKGVTTWLKQANIAGRFQRMALGDESYQRTFPFVEQRDNAPIKIIKPLNLSHKQPSKIIDHGGSWLFALDTLKRRGLMPENALFTVAAPSNGADRKRIKAYKEIVMQLEDTGVEVIKYDNDNSDRVLEFARL